MIGTLVIDDSAATHRRALLDQYLTSVWGTPYQVGTWDCILFIAAWADHLTGSNHLADLRGTYQSEHAGRHRHAPRGLNAAIHQTLLASGWTEIPIRSSDLTVADGVPLSRASFGVPLSQATFLGREASPPPVSPHQPGAVPSEISNLKSEIPLHPGDIILTDLDHPGIWNGATIVAQPARAAGLLQLHSHHALSLYRIRRDHVT